MNTAEQWKKLTRPFTLEEWRLLAYTALGGCAVLIAAALYATHRVLELTK